MAGYVAFLRGLNVGKNHRASSADLRAVFTAAGFDGAATFRTSGNVAFGSSLQTTDQISRVVEEQFDRTFGFAATAFVRSAIELSEFVATVPFDPATLRSYAGTPQVIFFDRELDPSAQAAVLELSSANDRLAIVGRQLCWLPSGPILESPLDLAALGRLVGTTTVRTRGTVELIAAKFCSS